MGHMVKGSVDVADEADTQAGPVTQKRKDNGVFSGDISKPVKIILGLSLIINIWALFSFLKTRSLNKKGSEK